MKTKLSFLLVALALVCLALPRTVEALEGPNDTAYGDYALYHEFGGSSNSAFGNSALLYNTNGVRNTAVGSAALERNTIGDSNTASGCLALYYNISGNNNTATGYQALFGVNNNSASLNTADGAYALFGNTTGGSNTANGADALYKNTTGSNNTADGAYALFRNTTGVRNTAVGVQALDYNTTGIDNTANGYQALQSNTTGNANTATGNSALYSNTTGTLNTATGRVALFHNTTGLENIALGIDAGSNLTTGNNNIDIGNLGVAGESNTIRIGGDIGFGFGTQTATYIAGISGIGVDGIPVFVTSSGQLGVSSSSARFKQNIQAMGDASDALLALRPVTFRYKHEIDPDGFPQFGLVAEEVEKVNPDLVRRDAQGKVFTVRYEAVNAMLLNEFLKEHKKVKDLEKDLRATIMQQQKEIEALTTGLQKVSAQLELRKRAPQTVANNQ
jgi:hypothetical protein